jgi:putative SOS response-associated peptidase YedK
VCGRYSLTRPEEVPDVLAPVLDDPALPVGFAPRYNIAPTHALPIVANREKRVIELARWGLVPSWADDLSIGARLINARGESLSQKPAFRDAFARRRCLVPADGFYEWTARAGGGKQAWAIRPRQGGVLAFAGLWETWRPRGDEGERLVSATIVTTGANAVVAPVHDRMPVCLPPDAWAEWLDPANDDVLALTSLLVPAPEDLLEVRPVGPLVGNVANDGPELLAEV